MTFRKQVFKILTAILISTSVLLAQRNTSDNTSPKVQFRMPANIKPGDYLQKTIIVKVRATYRSICSFGKIEDATFNQLYTSIGGTGLTKKFPAVKAPERILNERGEQLADLSLIYEFNYSADVSLEKIINKFASLQLLEYAEPHYIPHLFYTPNDPSLSAQYAITNIRADSAWGINSTTARGDTNIVIGITDTGTEPTHDDLKNQIKHNYADPIDGSDNDGDGYVDNFSGWDLGENDNDPAYTANSHGVHVSGIAAAEVDNSTGVAGIGYHCKFLPVKISDATGTLSKAYEGITYAADHGCAIINCSWGGGGSGQLGQDVITYATINKNALVIAAAGNNGLDEAFFPAAYTYVISVANTKSDDRRSASSNFNYSVDVCAPGESILSTYPANGYSSQTGTSMSSPCAAGAAAIIKSYYPSFTALQVGECLKVSCDNIYPLMNPVYANKLGKGRINLFKALTQVASPSVVMTQRNVTDSNDNTFVVGDSLRIAGTYTNYLAPSANLTATLSTTSPFVSILNSIITLGALNTLGVANNYSNPYIVKIEPGTPQNQVVSFKLTYSDPATTYTASEFFSITVNVDYINIAINDIATSISSHGRIGYSLDGQAGGLGFNYMNTGTVLYEGGFMVGTSGTAVSDAVRGATAGASDVDFQSEVSAHSVLPAVNSEFDVDGNFNDAMAQGPLPVRIHQKAFAWSSVGNRKYVIVQYVIINNGTSTLSNLYAGIFADWDIDAVSYASNRASFDAANKMGYAYYTGTAGRYAGIKLLTHTAPVIHYAIDNFAGGGGGADLSNGYDGAEKYSTLSTSRTDAGLTGAGSDVIDVVGSGPYSIATGDSVKVAFALIAGDSLLDIQNSAVNAQLKYDGLTSIGIVNGSKNEFNGMVSYPNPANELSIIELSIMEQASVDLKVIDVLGKEIKIIASGKRLAGKHRFKNDVSGINNGLYYYQLTIGNKKYIQKLIVAH